MTALKLVKSHDKTHGFQTARTQPSLSLSLYVSATDRDVEDTAQSLKSQVSASVANQHLSHFKVSTLSIISCITPPAAVRAYTGDVLLYCDHTRRYHIATDSLHATATDLGSPLPCHTTQACVTRL